MKAKGSAFFLAALLQVGAPLNAKELVDLAAACRSGSDAVHSDELRLPAQDGMVRCLDRHAYLPNVSIKAAQLRYSDALDLYMLSCLWIRLTRPDWASTAGSICTSASTW